MITVLLLFAHTEQYPVISKLLYASPCGGAMPLHQTNNELNPSSAEWSGLVSMVREIPLLSNSPRMPTKDCSGE